MSGLRKRRSPCPPCAPCEPAVRILGIDPGTVATGWGVLALDAGRPRLVACGVLRAARRRPLAARLAVIFAGLEALLAKYRPAAAALEQTFAGRNPHSAITMGEGRGVALLALVRAGIPVCETSPAEVKKAVTGHGGASKELVARMVCARLGLARPPQPPDVTDALAGALTLAQRVAPRARFPVERARRPS